MTSNVGAGLSLLVPFRDDYTSGRAENWDWLRRYWERSLPGAEIVVGDMPGIPFSKTRAVNAAFRRCSGDVVVLLDADCYIDPQVILEAAGKIRQGRIDGEHVWFVPYTRLYRLEPTATRFLIASDPADPFPFSDPPDVQDVGPTDGAAYGHWFGALIQIMPREAFEIAHGMNPKFAGWGGEDVAFMLCVDTLFGIHRMSDNQVLTLWHTVSGPPGSSLALLRTWPGQENPRANWGLAGRYRKALRDPARMRAIIQEWREDDAYKEHLID